MTCLIWLPLRAQYYDGATLKTKDVAVHGVDALVGDGSTAATFPTQLMPRGESLDGGDYLQVVRTLASSTYTVMLYASNLSAAISEYLFDARAGGGTGYCYLDAASRTLNVSSGTVYVNGIATTTLPRGQHCLVVVVGISLSAPTKLVVGAHNTLVAGQMFAGKLWHMSLFSGSLTLTQVRDLWDRCKWEANT